MSGAASAKQFSDVARLPGCGHKIAELYQEWVETGRLTETADAASDPRMAVLRLFYEIWGVGDTTAREFHKKGEISKYVLLVLTNAERHNRMARPGRHY